MLYDHTDYLRCLPPAWQARATIPPETDCWAWRGMQVHIARVRRPQAPARLMILHGAGGHAGALWPAAALAAEIGYDVLVPDLPGYGRTRVPRPGAVRYPDWVACVADLLRAEQARDDRPLVLVGASMGGLLAYSAAARAGGVAHLVVTCLLDPRDRVVWSALSPLVGRWSLGLMKASARLTDPLRLPIRWLTPMQRIANDPRLSQLCCTDERGGGGRIALGFLRTWLGSSPEVEPEAFTAAPVVLAHPADDRWTPASLSLRFFERIAVPKRYLPLLGAGHFPVEEPGISQLQALFAELFAGFVQA